MQAVQCASKVDDEKPRLRAGGFRVPRHVGPGEETRRKAKKVAAVDERAGLRATFRSSIEQVLRNSGRFVVVIMI